MVIYERKTVYEEVKEMGIEREVFDRFYISLESEGKLPSSDDFPSDIYSNLVTYLQQEGVLGNDNKLLEKGKKNFDLRMGLEGLLENWSEERRPYLKSSGGVAPCRTEHNYNRSSGGILPCRY